MNRVLIVDDEDSVLEIVGLLVEKLGFIAIKAKTAKEALKLFRDTRPGIILADLNLGNEMDGVALCSMLRYEDSPVVVMAMSGHFNAYDKAYCLSAGFSDFLEKPIDMDELKSALQCAFDRRSRWMNLP